MGLLAVATVAFLLTEIALAVSPTHLAVRILLVLNCTLLFALSRGFFLLCLLQQTPGTSARRYLLVFLLEALALPAMRVIAGDTLRFFHTVTLDRVIPGTLFAVLVSLSASWVLVGVLIVATSPAGATRRQRRARAPAVVATLVALSAYLAGHLLPGNRTLLIFPSGMLVAVALYRHALVRLNLLDLLLVPLTSVVRDVDTLIVALDEEGRVTAANRSRYGPVVPDGVLDGAGLASQIVTEAAEPGERAAVVAATGLKTLSVGRIDVSGGNRLYRMEYRTTPLTRRGRIVGWVFTLLDVTEEEASTAELELREARVRAAYEELRVYGRQSVADEARRTRERLIRDVNVMLRGGLTGIVEQLESLEGDPGSGQLLESAVATARQSLDDVRQAARVLRETGEGGWT